MSLSQLALWITRYPIYILDVTRPFWISNSCTNTIYLKKKQHFIKWKKTSFLKTSNLQQQQKRTLSWSRYYPHFALISGYVKTKQNDETEQKKLIHQTYIRPLLQQNWLFYGLYKWSYLIVEMLCRDKKHHSRAEQNNMYIVYAEW